MYTFEKTIILYNICSKCARKSEKTIIEEVLTKISKVLDLVNNIEKCEKDENSWRKYKWRIYIKRNWAERNYFFEKIKQNILIRKEHKNICKIIVSIYLF